MAETFGASAGGSGTARRARAGSTVAVRLLPDLLEPLDRFRADQGGISRPEAIRLLLRDGLLQADAMPVDPNLQSSLDPEPDQI